MKLHFDALGAQFCCVQSSWVSEIEGENSLTVNAFLLENFGLEDNFLMG